MAAVDGFCRAKRASKICRALQETNALVLLKRAILLRVSA